MKTTGMVLGALALLCIGPGLARADFSLDLVNPGGQTNTPYNLFFTATTNETQISFAGYQVPSSESATDVSLIATGSSTNLLGQTWAYTPAAMGSDSSQYNDGYGTGTNGLKFGGDSVGYFDTYTQTISTTVGQSYDLKFLFSNNSNSTPSEFRVIGTDVVGVPEADGALMLGLGALMLCVMVPVLRRFQPSPALTA